MEHDEQRQRLIGRLCRQLKNGIARALEFERASRAGRELGAKRCRNRLVGDGLARRRVPS
jgi:hypothetical protein